VKPTADFQDHQGSNGWDWNCSGMTEKINSPGLLYDCSPPPECRDMRRDDDTLCGMPEDDVRCVFNSGTGQCNYTDPVATGRTTKCR
jgi:hypothetical protein